MSLFTVYSVFAVLAMHWIPQASNSTAGLRGLSVVSERIAWATGTKGTVLRTADGGAHWDALKVSGAEALDFRDVQAFDLKVALIMSSGSGPASRLYRTVDGGLNWTIVLRDPDQDGFFDAMKFWDRKRGILLGDPVGSHFTIYVTSDGGLTWSRLRGPAAAPNEGAFAASGTCLSVLGHNQAWFGTGGINVARVFHTTDGGNAWTVSATPLFGATPSSGIFSILFINPHWGIAVGGDYQKPGQAIHTLETSTDNGVNWNVLPIGIPAGFRSAVAYVKPRKMLIAVGSSGSDHSLDLGRSWQAISNDKLNAVASHGNTVWAVGPNGVILKLSFQP